MEELQEYDALVSITELKDITSDKINRKILHWLKNNDRNFSSLSVDSTDEGLNRWNGSYCPSGLLELGWLGYFIGKNKHLTSFTLGSPALDAINFSRQQMTVFSRGFVNNKSIQDIGFNRCELVEPGFFQLLGPFFQNNHSLVNISFVGCNLSRECARYLQLVLETCARSLNCFYLRSCRMDDHSFAGVFGALRMHSRLKVLNLSDNVFDRNRYMELATLLRGSFTNLQCLCLEHNTIDDEALEELVFALTENSALKALDLDRNSSITPRGLQALSHLLESPNCRLEKLYLSRSNVDDEAAIVFANALAHNQSLKILRLGNNPGISAKGWMAFSRILCDTSSIEKTFLSNHTVGYLWMYHGELPSEQVLRDDELPNEQADLKNLDSSLNLNRSENKTHVAVNKILKHHLDFSMRSFLKWDLKMLPLAISWLERASDCARDFEAGIEQRKLSAIYQFARDLPWLFDQRSLSVDQSTRLG